MAWAEEDLVDLLQLVQEMEAVEADLQLQSEVDLQLQSEAVAGWRPDPS